MLKLRRVGQAALLAGLPAAVMAGAGLAVHGEALVVAVGRQLPAPGTADPAYVEVSVRNRLAVLVPVRGSWFSPAWMLERRTPAGKWQPIPSKSSPPRTMTHLTWLYPFQRVTYRVAVDRPGTFRIVAYSGRCGTTPHLSPTVSFGLKDFDHPPFAH